MRDDITLAELRRVAAGMKRNSAKPEVVLDQDHADYLNELDEALGLEPGWKIGDTFYTIYGLAESGSPHFKR
jgi:hypothetical protein